MKLRRKLAKMTPSVSQESTAEQTVQTRQEVADIVTTHADLETDQEQLRGFIKNAMYTNCIEGCTPLNQYSGTPHVKEGGGKWQEQLSKLVRNIGH